MTDKDFRFEGSDAFAFEDEPAAGPNKKLIAGVGALAVVVGLAAGGWFLTSGGGTTSADSAPLANAHHARPSVTASPSASPSATAVQQIDAVGARNPFISQLPNVKSPVAPTTAPVVTAPAPSTPASGTGTTVPGTVPGTIPGTTVPGTTVPGTTVPGTTVPGTVTTPGVTTFKVVSVASDDSSVNVLINGLAATAAPGATLDINFSVLRLEGGNCGSFAHGTQKFDMCEGGSVTFS
jgi:hypothetical protein